MWGSVFDPCLLVSTLCASSVAIALMGNEERAGCITLIVFQISCDFLMLCGSSTQSPCVIVLSHAFLLDPA